MQFGLGPFKFAFPPKPQETRGLTGEVFTVIYKPVRSKWFDVVIRNIKKPNPESSPMHGHGVEMVTLCLRGGYDDSYPDGHGRHVRPGRISHFKAETFHTAHTIHGRTGAWTIGIDCRWRGLRSAGYLIDGQFVSMWKYAEMCGAPEEVVEAIKSLTMGERARRAATA